MFFVARTILVQVLEGIPPSAQTETRGIEDSPPSVESLRATLQVLREKDGSEQLCAAKTVPKADTKIGYSDDKSTAAALESAAVNLANAAAEAAIALEWRQ